MFSENVEHFNKKTSKGAMHRVAQHLIGIKDENEAKYTSILNPGIKISNYSRKFQDERSNTGQF